jgi:AraC-like DNA-binding protein/DNA gyrase inhibitor GyrI
MARKKDHQTQFHRSQVGRAKRYIRLNLAEPLSLKRIAREAGSSSYHFLRLFQAYGGETPFEFMRRIRLITALRMLQEDPDASITEIAMSIGYETVAAFNKIFRKQLALTPSEFRKLGKEEQDAVVYDQSRPRLLKEVDMNLTTEFEAVTRPVTHYAFLEKQGPFAEVAPPLWDELHPLLKRMDEREIREFLGVSGVDKSAPGEEAMIYQAGVALADRPDTLPPGMQQRSIPAGKYARFVLTGPYAHIGRAFSTIFKTLEEKKVTLRPEFCIENYVNDPKETPEDQLKTELLVPIA